VFAEGQAGTIIVSYNSGQTWQQHSIVDISFIREILVHPSDTNTIFCAEFVGGLLKTTDNGNSWNVVLEDYGIDGEAFSYDPQHPDTMYAGNFNDASVYRSSDRGTTWQYQGDAGDALCALAIRPDSGNILYAGAGSGRISKSTDEGVSWYEVKPPGSLEIPRIVIDNFNPRIAYAAAYAGAANNIGVFKTTDGGEHWFLTPLNGVNIWSLDIDKQNPSILYAGSFSESFSTVYRTVDGGEHWTSIHRGLTDENLWSIKVHPADSSVVWVAGASDTSGIYSLNQSRTNIICVIRDAVTFDTIKNGTVTNLATGEVENLASTRGIYTFSRLKGDSIVTPVAKILSYPYYSKEMQYTFTPNSTVVEDVFLDKLPQTTLRVTISDTNTNTHPFSEAFLTISTSIGSKIIADSSDENGFIQFDSLYITYEPIISYSKLEIVSFTFPYGNKIISSLILDSLSLPRAVHLSPADVLLVNADTNKYYSYFEQPLNDLGITTFRWFTPLNGMPPYTRGNLVNRNLIMYCNGTRNAAFSSEEIDSITSYINRGGNMFITGQNILEQNSSYPLFADTFGVVFDSNTTNALCKSIASGGIFGNIQFTTLGAGANNQYSRDVLAVSNTHAIPVVAYGTNGTQGIAAVRADSIGANHRSKVLLFGFGFEAISQLQSRKSVMQRIINYFGTPSAAEENSSFFPSAFFLEQNFPNPFNPLTTIHFTLPASAMVSLKVYDMLGREIATLIHNERKEAGNYYIEFDATTYASGIYFYKLTTGNFSAMKKMVVLK
jgi:photosystem II stability/assembly factor-like uncharacterized protein